MPPSYVTQEQHKDFCDKVEVQYDNFSKQLDQTNGQIFDIKDNHLKHIESDMSEIKGKLSMIIPYLYAIFGVSILAALAALFDRFFK